ncbi:MAG: MaoC/PaaZ C-terminal domain-containing protein [Actinomycetota bacterium]
MPIDPGKAVGFELPPGESSWDADDVILYHLGVGAGDPPTDPGELEYGYEANLKVLPSFGVIPVFGTLGGLLSVPGIEFNPMMLLHGEQDLEIHRPIPTSTKAQHTARISNIYDRGKGALVEMEAVSRDANGPLFTNRFGAYLRGEGEFGGERGPRPGNLPPEREPDSVVESKTLPQQALLYRLSGDKNPLHADPSFAQMGGFEKPILHGLCTFGIVCKAVVDNELGGDVTKVARYHVRFSGVVYPGETIVTSMWREGSQVIIRATSKEREAPVLTNAAVTVR